MPKKKQAFKTPPPELPVPRKGVAETIENWLIDTYQMPRPPEMAARLLALVLELHHRHQPFPLRSHVADGLNCSVYGVDSALSIALARGLISIHYEVIEGHVAARESVIKQRFYIPSAELLEVAEQKRRAA